MRYCDALWRRTYDMRTTLDIDPDLLDRVVETTGECSKTKAVTKALEEYVRRAKIDGLRAIGGKIPMVDTRSSNGRPTDVGRLSWTN